MAPKRKSPYEVTSSSMERDDFVFSHPFVTVRVGKVPKFDFQVSLEPDGTISRVNGVDKGLLNYFMREHFYPAMQKASVCYHSRTTENKFRALASCFFPIFTYLAPEASDAHLLTQHERGAPPDDATDGLDVVEHDHAPSSSNVTPSSSRNEVYFIQERSGQGVDLRGYAIGTHQRFTLLVADAKQKNFIWDAETEPNSVVYQLGDYACCAAVSNIDKDRFKPIYILALADGVYGIAYLDVEGYFSVDEDGQITDDSFDEFISHRMKKQEQCNPGVAAQVLSDEALEELQRGYQTDLDKSRNKMRKKRLDDSIPVGAPILVGEIVFHPLTRSWTQFPIAYPAQSFGTDDYVFIAGLLRILYGDRVLLWTRNTLEALCNAHDAKLQAMGAGLLNLR